MKRKLPRVIALAVVAVVAALVVGGWWFDVPSRLGWHHSEAAYFTLYGNVDIRQVQLGFRVSGRIAEATVDEGDHVAAGQLLARLDAQPYEDAVRAAAAQAAGQAATLAKLEAGPRPAEIDQGRAALAEQAANLVHANLTLDRSRRLRPNDTISQSTLDQDLAARDMASARVASARETLRLLEEGTRIEDIEAGRAALQAAQANLAAARTSLGDTRLCAPAVGTILSRVREPGSIAAPGDAVYVLSLETPVWVRAYIAEPDLGRIRPGMAVDVMTDSFPGRPYRAHVGFISPVAEFTPKSVETPQLRTDLVYRLRVIVDQAADGLRQGMPVTVRIPRDAGAADGG